MITLLSPASLWTLAALALPLAIHLWRRPPRTVRWGSLRFLQTRARRWQNLRWREIVLLLARVGLLASLALLLAHPIWRQPPSTRPQHRALLDPAAAPAGPSLDRLHALQSAGVETHLLTPAFPSIHAPPADSSAPAPDLWSLLREADATLPAGSSLAVFSPGRISSLHGIRPSLAHCRVEWIDTPAAPATSDSPPTLTPTALPLTVLILHDADRAEDARYVAAALRAVSETDKRPLAVSVALTTATTTSADWIFWLGALPVPPTVASHAAHLLSDAESSALTETLPSWIVAQPGVPGAAALGAPVRLWQRTPPTAGSVLWTDGFGHPLLTRTDDTHGARWHFASRFNPAWNDLPLGTALPASLRALLAADNEPTGHNDRRLADPTQCAPSDAPAASAAKFTLPAAETDFRQPFWLLASLLFVLERLLSHRRAPRPPAAATPAAVAEPALSR